MYPRFSRRPQRNELVMQTMAATRYEQRTAPAACLAPDAVLERARAAVRAKGGSVESDVDVLGQVECQFGRYRGASFRWMVENCLGYCAWMVSSLQAEKESDTPLSKNKFLLKQYVLLFPEGREALRMKTKETQASSLSSRPSTATTSTSTGTGTSATASVSTSGPRISRATASALLSSRTSLSMVKVMAGRLFRPSIKVQPNLPPTPSRPSNTTDLTDVELVKAAEEMEAASSHSQPAPISQTETTDSRVAPPQATDSRAGKQRRSSLPEVRRVRSVNPPRASASSTSSRPVDREPAASDDQAPRERPSSLPSVRRAQSAAKCGKSNRAPISQTETAPPQASDSHVRRQIPSSLPEARHARSVNPPRASASASTSSTSSRPVDREPAVSDDQAPRERPSTLPSAKFGMSNQDEFPLPDGWRESLPVVDHQWVSKALFRWSDKGKPELDDRKVDRLWYHPPQPSLRCPHPPRPDPYFARKLLVWMPKRLWRCRFVCPNEGCERHELTSCGIYRRVRQVLDMDAFYSLAAEYLECTRCSRKLISWSLPILEQLDLGHRLQLPVVLTYRYACDIRVVRTMRQRGLGNGPMQLMKTLQEEHSELWLQQTALYLSDREPFVSAESRGLLTSSPPEEPPAMPAVPKFQWLLSVYCQDVSQRLVDVQAAITSTFGSVLKMDSTKKIVKKLTGKSADTAAWATNVGNEYGQVLMSVLTSHEGSGLEDMVRGLRTRYHDADVAPPVLLYVDRDCCNGKMRQMIQPEWSATVIRLDIWHFMRRLAAGVTTESHQLYKAYMGRLSQAIFAWDRGDFEALKDAKRAQMLEEGIKEPSDSDVLKRLGRKELALHCRRVTRGVEETTRLIDDLLETFTSDQGRDTLGVPLLDSTRTWQIWEEQKRHVACIQDPPTISLYTRTGQVNKGGRDLNTYRCARGSTSLESFHLHMNRFVPGNSASDIHFQAYLVEGLARWNQDRAAAAVAEGDRSLLSYSGRLQHGVSELSRGVLGHSLLPNVQIPRKYTGERIGMEYLLHQSSDCLATLLDPTTLAEQDDSDEGQKDEGFEEEEEDSTIFPCLSEDHIFSASVQQKKPSRKVCSRAEPVPEREPEREPVQEPEPEPLLEALSKAGQEPVQPADNLDESVGPDNIPGYRQVLNLAHFLVFLRRNAVLTNREAGNVILLYNQLGEYDKRPTVFAERVKAVDRGRFKSKGSSVIPGVLNTRRCFLGTNAGPAQRPDCNRLMEAIVKELCDLHPADVTTEGRRTSRWSLVLQGYSAIRRLVLDNARVMEETSLQLADINQATLVHWHNTRVRQMERTVLEQGLRCPLPSATATQPLPPANPQPSSLETGNEDERHQFVLPENTAGTAKTKRRRLVPSSAPLPVGSTAPGNPYAVMLPGRSPHTPAHLLILPPGLHATPPQPEPPSGPVPRSTQWYRKRRMEMKNTGQDVKINKKRKVGTTCGQCGLQRRPENHRQYYGAWWCQVRATMSYEEWLRQQVQRRTTKKGATASTDPAPRQ